MVWLGLYSTNLNGPVPIGAWRISRGETWHGYIGEKPEASRPSNAGCGAFSLKTASLSPLAVTLSTLAYQPWRKLTLKFSGALPCRRSMVHFTSAAVNGLPSCHLTPLRRGKVSVLPSPLLVPFSWIDMLAGLSRWVMRRMPPCFWAEALPKGAMSRNARTTNRTHDNATRMIIGFLLCSMADLVRRHPPVDHQFAARDPRRFVGGEVEAAGGDVIRRAEAAERSGFDPLARDVGIGMAGDGHRRVDEARMDRVHADLVGRVLDRRRLGKDAHRALGGMVGRVGVAADDAADRRDVDDRAAACALHGGHRGL